MLGPAFGRTDFSRIFIFEPPDFFADFLAGFFLLIFVGEKVPRKILPENPRQNPPKFIQQKSPTHFCRGAGPKNALIRVSCHSAYLALCDKLRCNAALLFKRETEDPADACSRRTTWVKQTARKDHKIFSVRIPGALLWYWAPQGNGLRGYY